MAQGRSYGERSGQDGDEHRDGLRPETEGIGDGRWMYQAT
jgi:hypothetical protein